MDKSQSPLFAELALGADNQDSTPTKLPKFSGTENPRHLRVITALLMSPRKREDVDRIAGASNGPELIAELRRRGLAVRCKRTPGVDRDGYPVKFGVYLFDDEDKHKVSVWLRQRAKKVPQ